MRRTLHRADFGSSCQEIEDEDAYVLNFYAGFNQESLEEDAEVMASWNRSIDSSSDPKSSGLFVSDEIFHRKSFV